MQPNWSTEQQEDCFTDWSEHFLSFVLQFGCIPTDVKGVYYYNHSILFRCAQPNRKPLPYDTEDNWREPTSQITGDDQTCLFIELRYVLRTLHSYSRSLELGYVHKLYGEMPDTKNQCKKLRCGEKTGNVYSKPMQVHLTSGV